MKTLAALTLLLLLSGCLLFGGYQGDTVIDRVRADCEAGGGTLTTIGCVEQSHE